MSYGGGHHARHTRNALQKENSYEPLPLSHWRWTKPTLETSKSEHTAPFFGLFCGVAIAGGRVHAKPEEPHHGHGHPVGPVLCVSVGHPDVVHLLLGVSDNRLVFERLIGFLAIKAIRDGPRAYIGWCHAGGVILIFSEFRDAGKYSLSVSSARGVVVKSLVEESPGRWFK